MAVTQSRGGLMIPVAGTVGKTVRGLRTGLEVQLAPNNYNVLGGIVCD